MPKRVFVAMSGGVDSSVAAALLKERGFGVVGIHMRMWAPGAAEGRKTNAESPMDMVCRQQFQDRLDAMRVAAKLDIPFQTWDFAEEYRRAVVEHMIREYAAGRTPNPDVMCNRKIKFGLFLERALEMGADYVATGHYALKREVKRQKSKGKSFVLAQARDLNKDQTYFLWTLTQKQLRHCLFPIGEYQKSEVREVARKFGLPTAEKPDSQGVCFIGELDMAEFLKSYIPERRGRVLTTAGRAVGEHAGVEFYTIGQRQGLGIGGGIPYYVAEKDQKMNTLVVAEGPYDGSLFHSELIASGVNWISGTAPKSPLRCEARIRYRQPVQECTIECPASAKATASRQKTKGECRVVFTELQRAVTPGQSIVFYRGKEMLGGGVITARAEYLAARGPGAGAFREAKSPRLRG